MVALFGACQGGGASGASYGDGGAALAAELSAALAGTPSAASRLAAIALMSSLSLTEVQYLLDADWGAPADASLWLRDPVLRKALAALAPGGGPIGTAAYEGLHFQGPAPEPPVPPVFITYDSAAFRQTVATAVEVMKQHAASPNICNPSVACDGAVVAAMLQSITDAPARTGPRSRPSAAPPIRAPGRAPSPSRGA